MGRPVGHPRTAAADYETYNARFPKEILEALRARSEKSGASMNTILVRMARRHFKMPADKDLERASA